MLLPVLTYGSEPRFIDTAVTARITAFYNSRVRSMYRLTRLRQRDLHVDSTALLRRLRIQPVHFILRRRQLKWYGDVARYANRKAPWGFGESSPIWSPIYRLPHIMGLWGVNRKDGELMMLCQKAALDKSVGQL